jgi:L-fuconolactonase
LPSTIGLRADSRYIRTGARWEPSVRSLDGTGSTELEILDSQVHTWTHDCALHPWDPGFRLRWHFDGVDPITNEGVLAAMDDAGVDAALIVVPGLYGWDNGYALEAARAHPDRVAVVGRFDARAPRVEERLREIAAVPGIVGVRINDHDRQAWESDTYGEFLAAAEEVGLPVCLYARPPALVALAQAVARYETVPIVIDHLGLGAPPVSSPTPGPRPFEHLPDLLSLARQPNVSVKLSAAAALSNEAFPFRDTWPAIREVVDAFGPDRVMWGSDFTRTASLHTYREALDYVLELDGLTVEEKAQILGRTLRRVFGWPELRMESSRADGHGS